ncbi:MAG TPA: nuclear transport factor 2 family protein [Ktedonobacteraceae bacterium]|nr:nuclear transport factor 2 family protein [Ktedonobacteraceae bacterium]
MTQTTDLAKRTPQEVFMHHAQTLGGEDLDGIMVDYSDASYLISPAGVLHGMDAIRNFFAALLQSLPQAQWNVNPTYVDNVMFLEWTADSRAASVSDGVDTFIFEHGMISYQTVRCTIVPK